jgi:hypothetical protein
MRGALMRRIKGLWVHSIAISEVTMKNTSLFIEVILEAGGISNLFSAL